MEKIDDNNVSVSTTQNIDIRILSARADNLQVMITKLQSQLDDMNSQIQQAADLGVSSAINHINKLKGAE